ncbi:cytochrome P450 [Sporichthya sp.]|uniref:cytochrome P450 n=1 Tax=Sporichthya sp. TaxID=65475 RepID=UPI0017B5E0C9|nr:cytochrome P450 [Sporichthya sp.]MBA3741445.1 cytochrome P450 [Sporichthya sp.]
MVAQEEFDHVALAGEVDPYAIVRGLREQCPVAHSSQYGGFYAFTRFEDVWNAALDTAAWSSAENGATIPRYSPINLLPIECDPPDHSVYRRMFLPLMSRSALAPLESRMLEVVNDLLDEVIERGECDLVGDVLFPMATVGLSHLYGLDPEQTEKIERSAVNALKLGGPEAAMPLFMAFAELVGQRRAQPGEDIPSMLIAARVDGEPIPEQDLIGACVSVFSAGFDTVVSACAHSFDLLESNPDQRAWLIEDPSRIPNAMEELLRYVSPLPGLARTATADLEVGDCKIPKGDRAMLMFLAANHDPEQYPEPEKLQLDRNASKHVAFGAGPHRCLGAPLGRLELEAALRVVLTRIPDYTIPDRSKVVRVGGVTRTVTSLPISFTPGPRLKPPAANVG